MGGCASCASKPRLSGDLDARIGSPGTPTPFKTAAGAREGRLLDEATSKTIHTLFAARPEFIEHCIVLFVLWGGIINRCGVSTPGVVSLHVASPSLSASLSQDVRPVLPDAVEVIFERIDELLQQPQPVGAAARLLGLGFDSAARAVYDSDSCKRLLHQAAVQLIGLAAEPDRSSFWPCPRQLYREARRKLLNLELLKLCEQSSVLLFSLHTRLASLLSVVASNLPHCCQCIP
jgi:hypothetical protein